MNRRLITATIALLFAACLPIPNVERTAPELNGRLVDGKGVPIAAATIHRVVKFNAAGAASCDLQGESVLTDSSGAFAFAADWTVSPTTRLQDDPVWRTLLCAEIDGKIVPAWKASQVGTAPLSMRLTCTAAGVDRVECVAVDESSAYR